MTFKFVLNGHELDNKITFGEAVVKYGLQDGNTLSLWALISAAGKVNFDIDSSENLVRDNVKEIYIEKTIGPNQDLLRITYRKGITARDILVELDMNENDQLLADYEGNLISLDDIIPPSVRLFLIPSASAGAINNDIKDLLVKRRSNLDIDISQIDKALQIYVTELNDPDFPRRQSVEILISSIYEFFKDSMSQQVPMKMISAMLFNDQFYLATKFIPNYDRLSSIEKLKMLFELDYKISSLTKQSNFNPDTIKKLSKNLINYFIFEQGLVSMNSFDALEVIWKTAKAFADDKNFGLDNIPKYLFNPKINDYISRGYPIHQDIINNLKNDLQKLKSSQSQENADEKLDDYLIVYYTLDKNGYMNIFRDPAMRHNNYFPDLLIDQLGTELFDGQDLPDDPDSWEPHHIDNIRELWEKKYLALAREGHKDRFSHPINQLLNKPSSSVVQSRHSEAKRKIKDIVRSQTPPIDSDFPSHWEQTWRDNFIKKWNEFNDLRNTYGSFEKAKWEWLKINYPIFMNKYHPNR